MEIPGFEEVNLEAEYDRLSDIFRKYYWDKFEYHNFGHPLEVANDMIHDIGYCEENGVSFTANEKKTLLGEAFGHDLGIFWPLTPNSGFKSVEERSGSQTTIILNHFGYDFESVARPAGELVLVTQFGSVCRVDDPHTTLLRKMARRTDMGNVGKDYEFFREKAIANWLEFQRLDPHHAGISLKDFWLTKAQPVVTSLTDSEDLAYGDFDREENGRCDYQNRCAENIARFGEELLAAA